MTPLTVVYSGHIHMNYDLDQRQRGGSLILTDQNRSAAKVGMYVQIPLERFLTAKNHAVKLFSASH